MNKKPQDTSSCAPFTPFGANGLAQELLADSHDLTRRESEVLEWIAEAKSDAEIAVILGISRRTVNHHVSRILRKMGVENRVAASRMVLEACFRRSMES
tara:strand:+ start:1557 stop:1853 length:297 start_codon:yes stop_codon:yes gene_type:complete